MDEVCIIGGGPAGIIASKLCISKNLVPIIYEKSSSPCGLWQARTQQIGPWNSLKLILSRFFAVISDHPWPPGSALYPKWSEYHSYLLSYISKHSLFQYFNFDSEVTQVSKESDHYLVTIKTKSGYISKSYKKVLIGIGLFSKHKDLIRGKEKFQGEILPAGFYRDPEVFRNKDVLVIGNSYSGCEIAYEATLTARSVTQLWRRKTVITKNIVFGMPVDIVIFCLKNVNGNDSKLLNDLENSSRIARLFMQVTGNPGDILEDLRINEEDLGNDFIGIRALSDEYIEALRNRKIRYWKGNAVEYHERGVVLMTGESLETDFVVDATGYFPNYDFLSAQIKETLEYDSHNSFMPLMLFRSCFHPDLPGLGFLLNSDSPFPGYNELLAEVCLRWIQGSLGLPEEKIRKGIQEQREFRETYTRCNLAYDMVGLYKEIMSILEIKIDTELIQELEYENGYLGSVFMFREREGQEEIIRNYVKDIKEAFPLNAFNG